MTVLGKITDLGNKLIQVITLKEWKEAKNEADGLNSAGKRSDEAQ